MFTFSQIDNKSSQSLISHEKIENNNEKIMNEHFSNNNENNDKNNETNNEESQLQFKCEINHKFSELIIGFMEQNKKFY